MYHQLGRGGSLGRGEAYGKGRSRRRRGFGSEIERADQGKLWLGFAYKKGGWSKWPPQGSPALRAENGWNFIDALLVRVTECWDLVVADLGSHNSASARRDNAFLPWCALHAYILHTCSMSIGICDSIEYLKLWQEQSGEGLRNKTIYVVNRHRADLPLGLERYQLNSRMRPQSHFLPPVKDGLCADQDGCFFVERVSIESDQSSEERRTLHEFQGIVEQVGRRVLNYRD